MTEERRYDEAEIAEIFEAAASPAAARAGSEPGAGAGAARGLTLAELQAIGREVGIAPERIRDAATTLARATPPSPRRRDLGMPIGTGRIVELPRPLNDREWTLLVTDLRETFGARGREHSHGEVRQWSNGNLHAFVEPTPSGYRLRLGTVKGDAVPVNRIGIGALAMAPVMLIAAAATGGAEIMGPLVIGGMGAAAMAFNALRLPRWAGERDRQMEFIAARARALLDAPDPPPS